MICLWVSRCQKQNRSSGAEKIASSGNASDLSAERAGCNIGQDTDYHNLGIS
jgi:hypothetical protein